MPLKKLEFYRQLNAKKKQYDDDNAWFGFHSGGPKWSRGTWGDFTVYAYYVYANILANPLHMALLGDTKLRSDPEMVFSFGLAANTKSPQEDKDKATVDQLNIDRAATTGVDIMPKGSILSAKLWSPMLNDAFMLGGIHSRYDFHFVLTGDEVEAWKNIHDPAYKNIYNNAWFYQRLGFEMYKGKYFRYPVLKKLKVAVSSEQAKKMWLKFFREVDSVLWNERDKVPRVFARELMGLKTFGYKPVFTEHEIGFIYNRGGQPPTFENYLNALNEANFQTRDKRDVNLRPISEFLFGDPHALAGNASARPESDA